MFWHSTSKPEYQADTQAKYIRQTWFLDCRFELILLLFFRLPYFLASVSCGVINLQIGRSKESLFSWIMICWFSPLCFPHPLSSFQPRPLFLFGLKFATWHSSIQPFCRLIPKTACMFTTVWYNVSALVVTRCAPLPPLLLLNKSQLCQTVILPILNVRTLDNRLVCQE